MNDRLELARRFVKKIEEEEEKPKPAMVQTNDGLVSTVSAIMLDPDWGVCKYMIGRKVSHEREGYIRYYCLVCQTGDAAPQLKLLKDASDWTHKCPRCNRKYTVLGAVQEPADFPYVPDRG